MDEPKVRTAEGPCSIRVRPRATAVGPTAPSVCSATNHGEVTRTSESVVPTKTTAEGIQNTQLTRNVITKNAVSWRDLTHPIIWNPCQQRSRPRGSATRAVVARSNRTPTPPRADVPMAPFSAEAMRSREVGPEPKCPSRPEPAAARRTWRHSHARRRWSGRAVDTARRRNARNSPRGGADGRPPALDACFRDSPVRGEAMRRIRSV